MSSLHTHLTTLTPVQPILQQTVLDRGPSHPLSGKGVAHVAQVADGYGASITFYSTLHLV